MDAKTLLTPFLDEKDYEALGIAISTGYSACDSFMRSNVVTDNFLVGMDQRSRLVSVFVEHSLTKLDGFHYEFKSNAAKNCWHTRVYKNGLAFTAHFLGRGKSTRSIPRAALNRSILAERNLNLFETEDFESAIQYGQGYCWIVHAGLIKPEFDRIAIPSQNQSFIRASTNLPLPISEPTAVEQIREEMTIELLTGSKAHENKAS